MAAAEAVRLGAAYNVFDGFELLRASIQSLGPRVEFVCVVYQTVSNFGAEASPALLPALRQLQAEGLVHELVPYEPREDFSPREKKALVSKRAEPADYGGGRVASISPQFFNELLKREAGRQRCAAAGCSHFMSLDADEFYDAAQLGAALDVMLERGYEGACCLMQHYYKLPTERLRPADELNHVSLIYKVAEHMPFRLAAPYPALLDPTRRLENLRRFHIFGRDEIEMHHMSLVRGNMRSKLANVSNRGNYHSDSAGFLERFAAWAPGRPLAAPTPFFEQQFADTETVDNRFGVDVAAVCCVCCAPEASRCSRCRAVYYCGRECQAKDWGWHRSVCS